MDPRNRTLIPLIIIFIFGAVIGYAAHKPETIVKVEYINQTIEKIVEVTVTPALTAPIPTATPEITATPKIPDDFTVKSYDPATDTPSQTIELKNQRANPDTLSIHPGDNVLIKINDYSLQSPMTLTFLNSSYTKNLGTSGAVYVTFNKKGIYGFESFIPSGDPTILPKPYAKGTITVS